MHTNAERVPSRGQCAYEPQRIVPERQLPSEARALACAGRVQCLRSGTGTSRSGVLPTNSERDRLSGRWQAPALAFAVMSPTLYNVFRRHMNWRQCALLPAAFADRARLPLDLKRCARDSGRALSLRAQQSLPQNTTRETPSKPVAPTPPFQTDGEQHAQPQGRLIRVPPSRIRNFSITAHVDAGKSTLADRLLERTGAVSAREMREQYLDSLELERERGITVKLQAARMNYTAHDGQTYVLNLIDTPGHVDFSYEVSRSLQACEGALLLVDATKGVEAQTLANAYLAMENNLEIVPILNKIDLPAAQPEQASQEVEQVIGIDMRDAVRTSAKLGIGIEETLEAIVKRIPPPRVRDENAPLRALIFDSAYDDYRGVVVYFRIVDGTLRKSDRIRFMANGREYDVDEIGVFTPKPLPVEELSVGEVGYLVAGIKTVAHARVGDTITLARHPASVPLPGYKEVKPMVFSGIFPADASMYNQLRDALEKLKLNDAALYYENENSPALGFGFRCGFLGLLHLDVVIERLETEYDLDLVTTAPSVVYRVHTTSGEVLEIDNPCKLPPPTNIERIEEPYVRIEMITPAEYVGSLMELAQSRRGEFLDMRFLTESRVVLIYEMALGEMVSDFFDQLKSRSKGFAGLDYRLVGYRASDLVKLDISIHGEVVDAMSVICHRSAAQAIGRSLCQRLLEIVPRQQFKVAIQARIGSKVIASEHLNALRKDVTAKLYGGDVTRKKKLLEKQKRGKKIAAERALASGIRVPKEAFRAILTAKRDAAS
jgi:GTP-binding protein LepA